MHNSFKHKTEVTGLKLKFLAPSVFGWVWSQLCLASSVLCWIGAVGGASTAVAAFLAGETPLLSTLLPVTEQNVVVGPFFFCLQHLGEAPLSAPLL